jgi:soluble lytic murein transglycosylase-like protein
MRFLNTHRCFPVLGCVAILAATLPAHAAEQVLLKNGFSLICDHMQRTGNRVQLFLDPGSKNFIEVNANEIITRRPAPSGAEPSQDTRQKAAPTGARAATKPQSLHDVLVEAGRKHDLDIALLESVIEVESGGNPHAVSPAGARGLMQLMPATAAKLGVKNSFRSAENIRGGTAYLDSLLTRYHNNLALALAAYNAGPGAVDRWHGIPPYPETRAYVARVIHEYNLRYEARLRAQRALMASAAAIH